MLSKKHNIIAQLISNQTNIFYLTGFKGVSNTEKEAYLLILPEGSQGQSYYIFTSNLYLEQAILQLKNLPPDRNKKQIRVIEISKDKPLGKQINKILLKNNVSTLEYEPDSLTVTEFTNFRKNFNTIKWIPIKHPIQQKRQLKNQWEIAQIKKAANLTNQCFDFIVSRLKVGTTEAQIAWEIEKFMREKGAQLAFSPIVAFGKHSSQPHYISANYKLRANNLVLLDFGARFNGYCVDMSRVIFLGKPSDLQKNVYKIVLLSQQKAINYFANFFKNHNNTPISDIKISGSWLDKITKNFISQQGFTPYLHSLGHGIGLDIHELPRLTIKKDTHISPGMVFTIEPAVYLSGQFGIRIEDTVLLTDTGLKILTHSPKKLIII